MIRQILSLFLVSNFVIPVAPVSAQDMTPNAVLKERLDNMPEEMERFRQSHVPDDWAARYLIQEISKGTHVEVRLRNGRKVVGRIEDITQDGLTLDKGRQLVFEEALSVQTYGAPKLTKTGTILLVVGAVIVFVVILIKASESI